MIGESPQGEIAIIGEQSGAAADQAGAHLSGDPAEPDEGLPGAAPRRQAVHIDGVGRECVAGDGEVSVGRPLIVEVRSPQVDGPKADGHDVVEELVETLFVGVDR